MLTQKGDFKMKNRINLSKYILSCAKNDFLKNAFFFLLISSIKKIEEKK